MEQRTLKIGDRKINQENRKYSAQSLEKYGTRWCDDRKAYTKAYNQYCLAMCKPDGSHSMTGALTKELYDILKPLSQKQRYFKYQEISV